MADPSPDEPFFRCSSIGHAREIWLALWEVEGSAAHIEARASGKMKNSCTLMDSCNEVGAERLLSRRRGPRMADDSHVE